MIPMPGWCEQHQMDFWDCRMLHLVPAATPIPPIQPTVNDVGRRVRVLKGYGLIATGETGVLISPVSACYYGAFVRLDVSMRSYNFDWKDLVLLDGAT